MRLHKGRVQGGLQHAQRMRALRAGLRRCLAPTPAPAPHCTGCRLQHKQRLAAIQAQLQAGAVVRLLQQHNEGLCRAGWRVLLLRRRRLLQERQRCRRARCGILAQGHAGGPAASGAAWRLGSGALHNVAAGAAAAGARAKGRLQCLQPLLPGAGGHKGRPAAAVGCALQAPQEGCARQARLRGQQALHLLHAHQAPEKAGAAGRGAEARVRPGEVLQRRPRRASSARSVLRVPALLHLVNEPGQGRLRCRGQGREVGGQGGAGGGGRQRCCSRGSGQRRVAAQAREDALEFCQGQQRRRGLVKEQVRFHGYAPGGWGASLGAA